MEQLLDGKEIVKSYGEGREKQLVLDHVSLEMERGGFVSVMGPSGSGKSTLLYTLSGMDSDYSGTVVFDGSTMSGLKEETLADCAGPKWDLSFSSRPF